MSAEIILDSSRNSSLGVSAEQVIVGVSSEQIMEDITEKVDSLSLNELPLSIIENLNADFSKAKDNTKDVLGITTYGTNTVDDDDDDDDLVVVAGDPNKLSKPEDDKEDDKEDEDEEELEIVSFDEKYGRFSIHNQSEAFKSLGFYVEYTPEKDISIMFDHLNNRFIFESKERRKWDVVLCSVFKDVNGNVGYCIVEDPKYPHTYYADQGKVIETDRVVIPSILFNDTIKKYNCFAYCLHVGTKFYPIDPRGIFVGHIPNYIIPFYGVEQKPENQIHGYGMINIATRFYINQNNGYTLPSITYNTIPVKSIADYNKWICYNMPM